eukprot:CAMPEP_0202430646 /NCGR_PEP_ID=MMETSP1345-20130828/4016_1 /ASSEMBLY_ACC=CAM_ASM_000843 /TAXON_ID=342563 /ORGANISM="Fabrea Fabrea salina" /LENGTH=67 /DNA_ID=CAMNT_0049042171 /DNA_START=86 /DNA_END=289 /DNA_ORIENTATION=+
MGKKSAAEPKDKASVLNKKEEKKINKLKAKIQYHEARREKDEADKIRTEIETIEQAAFARDAAALMA